MSITIDAQLQTPQDYEEFCRLMGVMMDYTDPENIVIDDGFGGAVITTSVDFRSCRNLLVAGMQACGRTTFLKQLLRSALATYPDVKIIVMDISHINEYEDYKPHVAVMYEIEECLNTLIGLSETDTEEKVFVIIEDFPLLFLDKPEMFTSALRRITNYRPNTHIFMATSLMRPTFISEDIKKMFSDRIVFKTDDSNQSAWLIGDGAASSIEFRSEFIWYDAITDTQKKFINPRQ